MKGGRWEVRLVGQGGQGLGLAGTMLAEAAIEDGNNATINHFFGAQKRGGPSQADVIIGTEDIDYPKVLQPDVFVIFSQEAFEHFDHTLPHRGLILVDSSQTKRSFADHENVIPVPLSEISEQATGNILSANMVALGVVLEMTKLVSRRSLMRALRKLSPRGALEANQAAMERGIEIAKPLKAERGRSRFRV